MRDLVGFLFVALFSFVALKSNGPDHSNRIVQKRPTSGITFLDTNLHHTIYLCAACSGDVSNMLEHSLEYAESTKASTVVNRLGGQMMGSRTTTEKALLFFAAACAVACGQNSTGSISGSVQDQSGAAMPGAKITITDTDTGTSRSAVADAGGRYSVPSLIPDHYDALGDAGLLNRDSPWNSVNRWQRTGDQHVAKGRPGSGKN